MGILTLSSDPCQGVQRRMVLEVNFFHIFVRENLSIVAIFDLVHDVETIFEPRSEKTVFLHIRKQRRRSASLPRS